MVHIGNDIGRKILLLDAREAVAKSQGENNRTQNTQKERLPPSCPQEINHNTQEGISIYISPRISRSPPPQTPDTPLQALGELLGTGCGRGSADAPLADQARRRAGTLAVVPGAFTAPPLGHHLVLASTLADGLGASYPLGCGLPRLSFPIDSESGLCLAFQVVGVILLGWRVSTGR